MAKILKITVAMLLCLAALGGCREIAGRFGGPKVVASVGDRELTMDQVGGIFTPGMTPQDSLKLLESYVDMWVRKQLKLEEAERIFSADEEDITRMVEEYRSSLLSNKLDQYWMETAPDSVFTDDDIAKYYSDHMFEFVLDRPIVKGAVVVVPAGFRHRAKLKELMGGNADQWEDFRVMSEKNGLKLNEFTSWTDEGTFLSYITTIGDKDRAELMSAGKVVEVPAGGNYILAYVSDRRNQGDTAPLDRVSDLVLRILYNQRRGNIIRSREDSLYSVAVGKGEKIEIKINNKDKE